MPDADADFSFLDVDAHFFITTPFSYNLLISIQNDALLGDIFDSNNMPIVFDNAQKLYIRPIEHKLPVGDNFKQQHL